MLLGRSSLTTAHASTSGAPLDLRQLPDALHQYQTCLRDRREMKANDRRSASSESLRASVMWLKGSPVPVFASHILDGAGVRINAENDVFDRTYRVRGTNNGGSGNAGPAASSIHIGDDSPISRRRRIPMARPAISKLVNTQMLAASAEVPDGIAFPVLGNWLIEPTPLP